MTPEQRNTKVVKKSRDGIFQKKEIIAAANKADWIKEERNARIAEQIDQISKALAVRVNGRGNIFVRERKLDRFAVMTGNLAQIVALQFNANGEKIYEQLCGMSELATNEEAAISQKKREQIVADAKHAIFEMGHEEEAAIRDARDHGQLILRRPDVDVRCVLGLAETMPEPHGI